MSSNQEVRHQQPRRRGPMGRGMQPGEKAQKKVEERNFEIRKNLLDYDDVLNQQRKFIYEQRDEILVDEDLSGRVMNNAKETVSEIFEEFKHERTPSQSALADK